MKKTTITEELNRIKSIMGLSEMKYRVRGTIGLTEEEIQHIYQPTGNSCGPTCLKMVGDFIHGDVGKIDDICKECGTDWVVGTPPDKMRIGLQKLNINYAEHQKDIFPFKQLRHAIDRGNVCIVRTITQGVPHWINIVGYNMDVFDVHDPWLGPIKYNEEELFKIWSIRDFFFFEILTGKGGNIDEVTIRRIKQSDFPDIEDNLEEVFHETGLTRRQIMAELEGFSYRYSVVAEVGGKIAGFYFLGENQIPEGGPELIYNKLRQLKGVEGVAVGVFKEFRGKDVGKKLILYPRAIPGIDYIWGYQLKSLKNIDDWLKRRKLYMDVRGFMYITYEIFKKDLAV